ncbi:MAG TPA: glycoside hydrolase domain-containing protein [Hanamia sp.]|nr:glycoside hydrolase domain-containing protein [Hanamia sp.]
MFLILRLGWFVAVMKTVTGIDPLMLIKDSFISWKERHGNILFMFRRMYLALAKLMGGRNQLEKELYSLFDKGEHWHGNEPGHQIPFMYNYTNAPWKSQRIVRKILSEEYNDGPGGLSGNDDAGQMSAWYIFGSIGFYPLDRISGNYLLVSPLFDSIKIKLPGNKIFKIITHKSDSKTQFIKEVKWNRNIYDKNYLQHVSIMKGGELDIWLQDKPTTWGSNISEQPKGLKNTK